MRATRLIDADKLKRKKKFSFQTEGGCFPKNEYFLKVSDLLAAPTVDAAPVIHCKDCKHSYEDIDGLACSYGVCVDCIVPPDFYCANGERKVGDKSEN